MSILTGPVSNESSKIVKDGGNFILGIIVLGKGNWPGNLFDSKWKVKMECLWTSSREEKINFRV